MKAIYEAECVNKAGCGVLTMLCVWCAPACKEGGGGMGQSRETTPVNVALWWRVGRDDIIV